MHKYKFLISFLLAMLLLSPVSGLADADDKDNRGKEKREAKKEIQQEVGAKKEGERGEKKEERKSDKLQHRKDQLRKVIDNMLERLTNTRERIGRMPNIDESLKAKLFVLVDEWVKKFTDQKTKVDNLKTTAEVKSLAKETKGLFRKYRDLVHEIVDAIHISQTNNHITKVENRANELDAKVQASLMKDGRDAAETDRLSTSARNHLDLAKKALLDKKVDEAVDHLKEARKDLNKLARALK